MHHFNKKVYFIFLFWKYLHIANQMLQISYC